MKSSQLSALAVTRAKDAGYYGDGGGLYLQVAQSNNKDKPVTKSWVFRFMLDGRAREMGLGSLQTFTLKEARERARICRQQLADGIDPIEARQRQRDEARAQSASTVLFKDAVKRFLEVHSPTWKNAKHRQQWKNTLRDYARALNERPVAVIDGALISETLAPIWTKKPETASRVKQRIDRVCQWVKDGQPLPAKSASQRVRHHPALPFAELPALMDELRAKDGISARALEFTILTVARTGDTIGARWSEIDLEAAVWTVSDGRHKTGKDFEIPLSTQALTLLKALPRERGGYVFPGAKAKKPLSNMAMLELLRGMRGNGLTVHGFRSTFRDWAGDNTGFPREVIEAAMSHQIKDKAEASYRRSSALEKRRKLMDAWAASCETHRR